MRKVVYNNCYGGFGLSPLAIKRYYELKYPDVQLFFYKGEYNENYTKYTLTRFSDVDLENASSLGLDIDIFSTDLGETLISNSAFHLSPKAEKAFVYPTFDGAERCDPALVQVVEELREKANGSHAELKIAEVEGKFRIEDYDGWETVRTPESYEWL